MVASSSRSNTVSRPAANKTTRRPHHANVLLTKLCEQGALRKGAATKTEDRKLLKSKLATSMSDFLAVIEEATFGSVQEFAATLHVPDRPFDVVFWPLLHNSAEAANELHARLPPMSWPPALLLPQLFLDVRPDAIVYDIQVWRPLWDFELNNILTPSNQQNHEFTNTHLLHMLPRFSEHGQESVRQI